MNNVTFTGMVLVCVQCLRSRVSIADGTPVDNKPPFAVTVIDGEARCSQHIFAIGENL